MKPLVSIIVPIFNVEAYISKCIDSILEQTYQTFEILLINDGSTDLSQNICEKLAKSDCRIKLYNKPNGGLSSARNYGLDRTEGKYVIFVDSDDYWIDIQTLEHLVNIAEKTNADIVRGEHKEVDEVGKDIYIPSIVENKDILEHQQLDNYTFLQHILIRGHFSWLFLIRKEAIGDLRFNIQQRFQEDIDFNIRFFAIPRICIYTPFMFYAYRKRKNSIMSTYKVDNLKYSFNLSNVWFQYSLKISDKKLADIYRFNGIMMYYWTLNTVAQYPYYNNCFNIIENLSLVKLNKKVRCFNLSIRKK